MNLFSKMFRFRNSKTLDKLGLYPVKFHVRAFPERRYLWTSRVLVIFAVLSFCLTIILTSVLFILLPQRSSTPSFYTRDTFMPALKKIEPIKMAKAAQDLLTEKYIIDYIGMRHAVPKSTADLFYRWNEESLFYWYSGITNYYDFITRLDEDKLRNFIKLRMKRQVVVDKVEKISKNLWMAQFRTITTAKGVPEPNVIIWRAYLRIKYFELEGYNALEKTEKEKQNYIANPFGFKVMSYSLAYAGKPEKAFSAQQTAKKHLEGLEDVVK